MYSKGTHVMYMLFQNYLMYLPVDIYIYIHTESSLELTQTMNYRITQNHAESRDIRQCSHICATLNDM